MMMIVTNCNLEGPSEAADAAKGSLEDIEC